MIVERINSHVFFLQGFRSARVADAERILHDLREAFPEVEIQLVRADRVAGREHLVFAARNAIDSFTGKARRAKHLSMEFLLFASGEHQIVEAIELLGVNPSVTDMVLVGLSLTEPNLDLLTRKMEEKVNGVPDDSVLTLHDLKKISALKRAYRITNREIESTKVPGETNEMLLKRLVIERSAMLVLEN